MAAENNRCERDFLFCISLGHMGYMQRHLQNPASLTEKNHWSENCLHMLFTSFCEGCAESIYPFLKEDHTSFKKEDMQRYDKKTILHLVSRSPNILSHVFFDIMEKLIEDGVLDVNEIDEVGKTAIHLAVEQKKEDIVVWLLEHGADPFIVSAYKKNAYDIASPHIRRIMESYGGCMLKEPDV